MFKRISAVLAGLALVAGFSLVTASPASATTTGCTTVATTSAAARSNEIETQEPLGGGLMTNPSGVGFRYQYLSTCNVIRINHITFTDAYTPPPSWDVTYVTNSLPTQCWVQFVDANGNKLYDEPHHDCYDGVDSSSYVTLASGLTASSIYYNILFQWGHANSHFDFQINSHA